MQTGAAAVSAAALPPVRRHQEAFRVPARIAYLVRGAMRRHAELTAPAAVRAAEAELARNDEPWVTS